MACCSNGELLDHALEVISPPKEKEGACRASIDEALRLVDMVRVSIEGAPSPAEFKRHVEAFANTLRKTKAEIAGLGSIERSFVFPQLPEAAEPAEAGLLRELDLRISICESYTDPLHVKHGSRPWDSVKHVCALQASILLKEFSPSRLSQAKKGHFFNLASLLYEIASGEEEKDLTAYCEDLDRVEPLYVVKIPNVLGL
jgi:hypothetical protein